MLKGSQINYRQANSRFILLLLFVKATEVFSPNQIQKLPFYAVLRSNGSPKYDCIFFLKQMRRQKVICYGFMVEIKSSEEVFGQVFVRKKQV